MVEPRHGKAIGIAAGLTLGFLLAGLLLLLALYFVLRDEVSPGCGSSAGSAACADP